MKWSCPCESPRMRWPRPEEVSVSVSGSSLPKIFSISPPSTSLLRSKKLNRLHWKKVAISSTCNLAILIPGPKSKNAKTANFLIPNSIYHISTIIYSPSQLVNRTHVNGNTEIRFSKPLLKAWMSSRIQGRLSFLKTEIINYIENSFAFVCF